VIEKERIKMRREEEEKIKKVRYNPRFKDIKASEGCPRYLKERNLENTDKGEEIRALIKLRCGNYENANKYWLNEKIGICLFCKKARDTLEHYVGECVKVKVWFKELGSSVKEIIERLCREDFDSCKGKILKKIR